MENSQSLSSVRKPRGASPPSHLRLQLCLVRMPNLEVEEQRCSQTGAGMGRGFPSGWKSSRQVMDHGSHRMQREIEMGEGLIDCARDH